MIAQLPRIGLVEKLSRRWRRHLANLDDRFGAQPPVHLTVSLQVLLHLDVLLEPAVVVRVTVPSSITTLAVVVPMLATSWTS